MSSPVAKAATADQIANARDLVELRVKEVSVVDRPAILRPFLVVKNMEGLVDELNGDGTGIGIEKADIEPIVAELNKAFEAAGFDFVEKQLPEALRASVATVVPWMRRMASQADGDYKAAIMKVATFLAGAMTGNMPVPGTQEKNEMSTETETNKTEGEGTETPENKAAPAGMAGGGAAGDPSAVKPDEEELQRQEKTKALSLDNEPGAVAVVKVDNATGEITLVTKGRKSMTPARAAALAKATGEMLVLLRDTSPEGLAKALAEAGLTKELPSNAQFGASGVQPVGVGSVDPMKEGGHTIKKNDEAPAWAQAIVSKVDAVTAKVEAIEKARSPSTSVAEDGGNANPSEVTVKKSLFSGVV